MSADRFDGRYIWHPAADDRRLAQACTDVRAGRYFSADQVLRATRTDFELRAHRSLVLASEAADSDFAERWVDEEPGPESTLLWARVAMLRALRGNHDGRRRPQLLRIAQKACERAGEVAPYDPTPWVSLLALAPITGASDQAPPGLMTAPRGPWKQFARVLRFDPWHREAHHRFLAHFFERNGGSQRATWDVASFLGHRAPAASALRLLPLVALVEGHKPSEPLSDRVWQQPQWQAVMDSIHEHWFPRVGERRFTPVLDLSYLAHALHMGNRGEQSREVLLAAGPYASRMPWSTFGSPEEELTRVRALYGLPVPGSP